MNNKDFQKKLDEIWLTLKLNAIPDNCDGCNNGCDLYDERFPDLFLGFKKPKKFKTQLNFRIRRYDDAGRFIGFEGYWQIFDCLVFLREDVKDSSCFFSQKSGDKIFQLTNDQAMDERELMYLERTIDEMLSGEIQSEYVSFMEPMFNFELYKRDDKPFMTMKLVSDPCCKAVYSVLDIFFNERDMSLFSLYLKLKRGAISPQDKEIKSMFDRGVLCRKKIFKEGSYVG